MTSVYACDNRLRKELNSLKPTPGYCIFIDLVDSVALKDQGVGAWCAAMYNLIVPARSWLSDLNVETGTEECDTGR
jgi:hypothetical protein